MKIITLDFETYYDKDFSLSKMTTEEYIRDDRFEVIGVGVKVNDSPATWFSGSAEEIKAHLHTFNMGEHLVLAHNAVFDAAILNWHFDICPHGWLDTLSMARAIHTIEVGGSLAALVKYYGLGEKGSEVVNALGKRITDFSKQELAQYGEYCKNDCNITFDLFNTLNADFPPRELRLIDLTIRMFSEPVLCVDVKALQKHLTFVRLKKEGLLAKAQQTPEIFLIPLIQSHSSVIGIHRCFNGVTDVINRTIGLGSNRG